MRKILFVFSLFIFHFSLSNAQHYVLYGTTTAGGSNNDGTIFKYDPVAKKETTLFNFDGANGSDAIAELFQASNGILYGTSAGGGAMNYGTAYSLNPYTNQFNLLFSFISSNGSYADNSFIEYPNGVLYGTTEHGGNKDYGVIHSYNISTQKDSVLFRFDSTYGSGPDGHLIQDSVTKIIYGMTYGGGTKNEGVLYSFNPFTRKDSVLINFDSVNGTMPNTITPVLIKSGYIYGMTTNGGTYNAGVIFRYNIMTGQDSIIFNFDGLHGEQPWANNLIQASDGLIYGMASVGGLFNGGVLFSIDPATNIYTVRVNLDTSYGQDDASGYIIQDPDNGLIYGTVEGGNPISNKGVIFSYNIVTGKDSILYRFSGPDGEYPFEGVTLVKDTLTGINELQANNLIVNVYPNPSSGVFTFQMKGINQKTQIDIYNILGEDIYNKSTNSESTQIDLSNQPKGLYLYRITRDKQELISSGKIIIQ